MQDLLVLIVDDDNSVSTALSRMLRGLAKEVIIATKPTESLAVALARQPHLILLDVRLGEHDGLDLLAEMRRHGIPARVLVVSGSITDSVRNRANHLGVLAVLTKPVTLDSLLDAVKEAFAIHGPLGSHWADGIEGSAIERWVNLVLQALNAPQDPHDCQELGRRGAMSLTTLKRICARVLIDPRETCDFTRLLGALIWSRRLSVPLEALLRIGDERTLMKLIERSGLTGQTTTATVRFFLDQQQFVLQENMAFRRLRSALVGPESGS